MVSMDKIFETVTKDRTRIIFITTDRGNVYQGYSMESVIAKILPPENITMFAETASSEDRSVSLGIDFGLSRSRIVVSAYEDERTWVLKTFNDIVNIFERKANFHWLVHGRSGRITQLLLAVLFSIIIFLLLRRQTQFASLRMDNLVMLSLAISFSLGFAVINMLGKLFPYYSFSFAATYRLLPIPDSLKSITEWAIVGSLGWLGKSLFLKIGPSRKKREEPT